MTKSARMTLQCSKYSLILLTPLFFGLFCSANIADAKASRDAVAMVALSVDYDSVLNDTRRHPTGVNMDYLMEDDRNPLLSPKRKLVEGLRELGPRYLRYPDGWKSAINLWSTPPYASSHPALAGRVPEEWIRPGLQLTNPDA